MHKTTDVTKTFNGSWTPGINKSPQVFVIDSNKN